MKSLLNKSLFIIIMGLTLINSQAIAKIHNLVNINNPDWTCTLNINEKSGVKFISEDPDFRDAVNTTKIDKIFYYIKRKATLVFTATYNGSTGIDPKYTIGSGYDSVGGGNDGQIYTIEVDMPRDSSSTAVEYGVTACINWKETHVVDGDIVTNYIREIGQFMPSVEFWKPLKIDIQNPYGAGIKRKIVSQKPIPMVEVYDSSNGYKRVTYISEAYPNVNVSVNADVNSLIKPEPAGWVHTDESGSAPLTLLAPLTAANSSGVVSGNVHIKATVDGIELESENSGVSTWFAGVKVANNVWIKDGLGGGVLEKVEAGSPLKKETVIQIGTALGSGALILTFCNGNVVSLDAVRSEGFYAIIGNGSIHKGANLLSLSIRNQLQEFKDMPRLALRMRLYKEIGSVLDSALAIPGFVSIATETPGSTVEKWLAYWGEPSYMRPDPPPYARRPRLSINNEYEITGSSNNTNKNTINRSVITDFSFNTDGSVYVESSGDNIQLYKENYGSVNLSSGAAIMIMPARGLYTNNYISETATSATAWEAPLPTTWIFNPTNSSIISNRAPSFSINTSEAQGIVIDTTTIRLDDKNITSWFDIQSTSIIGNVPDALPLCAGAHTLSMGCKTLKGTWQEQSTSFTIATNLYSSNYIETTPFSNGVWVSWVSPIKLYSYNIWRASATNGTKYLLTSELRKEPGFLDESPLGTNFYWLEIVDGNNISNIQEDAISAIWSNTLPTAPEVSAPQALKLSELPEGIEIDFDNSAYASTRWKLERGTYTNSSFEMLATQDQTIARGYIDDTVIPGSNYYYRLTAMTLAGVTNLYSTTNIVVSTRPSTPRGVTAVSLATGNRLSWNKYYDIRATGIKIYKYSNSSSSFVQINTLPISATAYTDSNISDPENLYQVRAYNNIEESDSGSVGVSFYQITTEQAVINLPVTNINAREGDGTIAVQVTRTGNLSEPAIITYKVWDGQHPYHATEDIDFTKSAGTLLFATNQISSEIPVEFLVDDKAEWAEELSVSLGTGRGSTIAGSNYTVKIILGDSDNLMMENYQSEISVVETNGSISIGIDRIWPSQHSVSAEITVSTNQPGTAIAGIDYIAFSNKTVTFPAGVSRVYVPIELLDDGNKDGPKILNVLLINPTNGACISSSFSTLAINIMDKDTHFGQLYFSSAEKIFIASTATNIVQIPLSRLSGADGNITANTMIDGGSIPPWGGNLTLSVAAVTNGETSTMITAVLDRNGLDPKIAPFCVISLDNDEHPRENDQLLLVFRPEGSPASPFRSWMNNYAVGNSTNAIDDPDQDGSVNIVEYALGTDPNQSNSCPKLEISLNSWYFSITNQIHPDPYLAVVGEFCDDLTSQNWIYSGGWWGEWDDSNQVYNASFSKDISGETSQFGRLRFIWLGQ